MTIGRWTIIKSAAWSLPVVAAAVAVPQAAASAPPRKPVACERTPNHGHGGGQGNTWWTVYYDDGTAQVLDQGTVMSDKQLKEACR